MTPGSPTELTDFMKSSTMPYDGIEWNPELYPLKYKFYRRAILRLSYYAVYYVIEENVTTVVAVLDMRQEPKRMRTLLESRHALLRLRRLKRKR